MDGSTDAVIIGNPNSGRAGNQGYLEQCAKVLIAGGLATEVLNTEHPNHATELAALAGDRLVIAAGGDGTVNEVINGLSPNATLGILPLGTANVLARELGVPRNTEQACHRILRGTRSRIDVGVATNHDGEERRFACMAGLGFDASVVRSVTPRLKRYLRVLAFPLMGVRVMFEQDLPSVHVVDGDTTYVAQFVVVANGHYYGGDFRVSGPGALTNGELETILVERVGILLRPDILARILARDPLNRSLKSFSSREVEARSPGSEVPVQIDGEIWGRLPMRFRIDPLALNVIC
jgi:diacylglycerol kinase (ATP)